MQSNQNAWLAGDFWQAESLPRVCQRSVSNVCSWKASRIERKHNKW